MMSAVARNKYLATQQDPKKMRYIEWLTTPKSAREPKSEALLAKELDVYVKTLYNWRHDPEFKAIWQENTDFVIGGDDRRQAVMDTLYQAASDPNNPRHVTAAKLYLEAIKDITPPKEGEPGQLSEKAIGMLTDEELDLLIQQGLQGTRSDAA
jgi:hypothetical protein